MNRDDIIRMAKDAGIDVAVEDVFNYQPQHSFVGDDESIERFAALIKQHLYLDGIHTCHDECQRPACVAVREAVKAERERCISDCNSIDLRGADECIAAIRARGEA